MDLRGVSVYLSGPVTGVEGARDAFREAEGICRSAGARRVWNPTEHVPANAAHEQAMRVCIRELSGYYGGGMRPLYGAVVQLPGWSGSEGCRTEAEVARACGVPCIGLSDVVAGMHRS